MAFSVEPFGPIRRWRRFTYRSLFRTKPPIFTTSHCTSSCRIFSACGAGTERDNSLIRSRALMMMYGSNVLRVVRTVIEPSTRFSSHATPCSFSARVTEGHTSRKYFSRYLGNNVANEDSSSKPPGLSSLVNGSTFQWSMPSWSCERAETAGRGVRRERGVGGTTRHFRASGGGRGDGRNGARRAAGQGTHPGFLTSVASFLTAGGGTAFGGILRRRVFHLGHGLCARLVAATKFSPPTTIMTTMTTTISRILHSCTLFFNTGMHTIQKVRCALRNKTTRLFTL